MRKNEPGEGDGGWGCNFKWGSKESSTEKERLQHQGNKPCEDAHTHIHHSCISSHFTWTVLKLTSLRLVLLLLFCPLHSSQDSPDPFKPEYITHLSNIQDGPIHWG